MNETMSTERPSVASTTSAMVSTLEGSANVAKSICAVDGCERVSSARGWCQGHYVRYLKHGDVRPDVPLRGFTKVRGSVAERFWARVQKGSGCWLWIGGRRRRGYGAFSGGLALGETVAHRFAWELANGTIPTGMLVCHHCDNPPCVKTEPDEQYPDGHLVLGTYEDNARDAISKGRNRWWMPTRKEVS